MNVTNIGSPMATPASQAAGADAAGASGFAGLLGTGAGNGAQGSLVFGTPVFGTFATAQPTTITAQTGAALLPGATDAGALPVASDRPQVAMTQLLATAAPVAAAPTALVIAFELTASPWTKRSRSSGSAIWVPSPTTIAETRLPSAAFSPSCRTEIGAIAVSVSLGNSPLSIRYALNAPPTTVRMTSLTVAFGTTSLTARTSASLNGTASHTR